MTTACMIKTRAELHAFSILRLGRQNFDEVMAVAMAEVAPLVLNGLLLRWFCKTDEQYKASFYFSFSVVTQSRQVSLLVHLSSLRSSCSTLAFRL